MGIPTVLSRLCKQTHLPSTPQIPFFHFSFEEKSLCEIKLLKILPSTHVCTQREISQKILGTTNMHIKKNIEKNQHDVSGSHKAGWL